MLHGRLRYHDEHLGQVEYEVYARDSFNDIKMYLINGDLSNYTNYMNATMAYDKALATIDALSDAQKEEGLEDLFSSIENRSATLVSEDVDNNTKTYMYNPYENVNPDDNRRLDIKKANKYKSNITNREFCSKVSALVRYVQMTGKKNYNQNLNDEDHFKVERLVNIDDLGYVKYEMGLIKEMNIKGKFVEITLTTVPDDVFDVGVFKELKEKDQYGNILTNTPIENVGFKLTTELLGFPYEPPYKKEPVNILGVYETIEDVIDAHPEKNTSWILDRDYHIVTDENLEEVMKSFYDHNGWIAFDTETTGLDINFKSRTGEADQLVGVVLSKDIGSGYYFPLQHKLFDNLCGGDHWYFMEKYMKKLLETKKIICHNLTFDWKVAYIYGINVNCLYDTMLALGVTKRYEETSFELSLSALVRNIFGLDMFDLHDFVTASNFSESNITFADLPYELVRQYAPTDTDMTLSLFEFIEKEAILDKYQAHAIFDMEVNFSKVVAYSEFYGYHINVAKIPEMHDSIVSNMEKYKQQMFEIAGKEFNPNSPQQLMKIMYDELGIEQIGEKRSTNKETLRTLTGRTDANGEPLYPFVVALKNYRDNEGIYKNFLKKLHLFATEDGFIFPSVMQLGTDTGRASVKNPNYQSYNDPVKKNIVPRQGYIMFDSDFSQIEYRVLASLAKQEQLMEEFDDPDLDYHSYQASRMFNVPYALVSRNLREQSKGVNFGLPYGMGDSSLGFRIYGERNKETQRKAAQLRRKFFQGQEKIEQFFEITRSNGVANNFTSTYFGRRRYYNRGVFSVNEIRRQAGNHVIQGTAADIYKLACNRLFNRIVDEGWLGLVLLNAFVHDELLGEVHESINPYYFLKAWREEFQLSIDGFCKLYAGVGIARSWYDAKNQDLPPQYLDIVIDKYHDDMEWNEDIDTFLKDLDEGYEEYKTKRVKDYIQDPSEQGEVIKPLIYSLLVEMTGKIVKEIQTTNQAVKLLKEYNALFEEELIPAEGKHKIKTLREYLTLFCHYHNIDIEKVDIKSPDEITVQSSDGGFEQEEIEFMDDAFSLQDQIRDRGYFRDDFEGVVYITDQPCNIQGVSTNTLTYFNSRGMFKPEGTFQLALFDEQTGEFIKYNAFVNEADYQQMVKVYQTIKNTNNNTSLNFVRYAF